MTKQRIEHVDLNSLSDAKLTEYEELPDGYMEKCSLCGNAIKHVYKVSGENGYFVLGNECVKQIAKVQGENTLEGITNIPEKQRSKVKVNSKKLEAEEVVIPW